jgi:hypothetical protein
MAMRKKTGFKHKAGSNERNAVRASTSKITVKIVGEA